ncbi:putative fluoride ion transporter CrcB [bioreactor metagenome]|uniref:Putative fluoride ion transporter CrcB n=1 Tax=bioreactor metagenome TaxID=1076179 RepID=A0A644YT42_9ZZZZ
MKTLLFMGFGGFIGTLLRFGVGKLYPVADKSSFPINTFIVNILGCFLIGLFYSLSEKSTVINSDIKLFLTVGLCGGFTTFSTFAHENLLLLKGGDIWIFALYTGLSIFLGILAVVAGAFIGNSI